MLRSYIKGERSSYIKGERNGGRGLLRSYIKGERIVT